MLTSRIGRAARRRGSTYGTQRGPTYDTRRGSTYGRFRLPPLANGVFKESPDIQGVAGIGVLVVARRHAVD